MIGYIYNTDTNKIICEIYGADNNVIENKANEMGYMGCDEYGLTYTRNQLAFANRHDYQIAGEC
jgi:hypothetical protein